MRSVSPFDTYHLLDRAGSQVGYFLRLILSYPGARLLVVLSLALLFRSLSVRAGVPRS